MNQPEPGRIRELVQHETGIDVDGLLGEMEQIPRKVYAIRQELAPLKAELVMLEARYESKGRSPSHFDIARSFLLSELKEEARVLYNRDPEFKEDAKGKKTKIVFTDGRAEDWAHASPRYRKFIEEAEQERRRIAELRDLAGRLYDKLELGKGRKEYLLQKLEQAKAQTYLLSSQMKL